MLKAFILRGSFLLWVVAFGMRPMFKDTDVVMFAWHAALPRKGRFCPFGKCLRDFFRVPCAPDLLRGVYTTPSSAGSYLRDGVFHLFFGIASYHPLGSFFRIFTFPRIHFCVACPHTCGVCGLRKCLRGASTVTVHHSFVRIGCLRF